MSVKFPLSRRRFLRTAAGAGVLAAAPYVVPASALGKGGASAAAEWATLHGRIVYNGAPPAPQRITITKDKDVCGKPPLFEQSLLVNSRNYGLKNVIVRLYVGRGDAVEIHDSYEQDEHGKVQMKSENCQFEPHVTAMRTTQEFVFHNADPKGDAVKIAPFRNPDINVTLTANQKYVQEFPIAERMPVKVTCTIHPWELGWLVITDHPYVAVSDHDGKFEIRNVPAGERRFMFWQEKAGYLSEVTFQGQPVSWRRGMKELDVQPGDNDLGEIIVQPSLFEK